MKFKQKTLDNGLTIIGEVNASAVSASVGFFTRTGSRDEMPEVSGVSHFLEHMLFKGTDNLAALEVNEAFDKIGAQFNAFTSWENTVYYAAVLPEYLADVTTLWAKLMRPRLGDDDFNMEKNVIKEEIAMYKDTPQFEVLDQCFSLHFGDHPCGNSVLGTNESIDALTSGQMRDYFNRRYSPGNITVALAGNFEFEKICDLLASACGDWKPQQTDRVRDYFAGTRKKECVVKENLVREHICLISPSVSYQDERVFAASLFGMIVGDDTGSRMFWELVDTAIAETASLQCEAMDGVGVFYSYIRTSPGAADKVMGIVEKIFTDVIKNGVSEDELQKAKNKMLSNITIKNEVPMGRLIELGFNWVYMDKYVAVAEEVKKIKAVTTADVAEIAREFSLMGYSRYSIGPKSR
ncbi:MAG: insulinase family protein [Anaerohalosphaeraceae bacterium]|nr:insulinase family protein [Anaerohalosphaeraceae bacterium]